MLVATGLVAGGCHDQDAADAGAVVCEVTLNENGSQGTTTCYRTNPDGGRLPPTEVISGGSTPVAALDMLADGVFEGSPFYEWANLRATGALPGLMTEADSLGNVSLAHARSFGNCGLHGTCEFATVFTETDAGPQLLPGASYSIRITGRERVPCEPAGIGEICNLLHGSIHSVLEPGAVVVDWSF
jgi:hypothetical protein